MKSILIHLPTLLLTVCVGVLNAQGPVGRLALPEEQRVAELRDARQQLAVISAKLSALEYRSGAALPRGIGRDPLKRLTPHASNDVSSRAPGSARRSGDIHA